MTQIQESTVQLLAHCTREVQDLEKTDRKTDDTHICTRNPEHQNEKQIPDHSIIPAISMPKESLKDRINIQGQIAYILVDQNLDPSMIPQIISDLKAVGIDQVDLSFANLSDSSTWDTDKFKALTSAAHQAGMKVDIAFGGAVQQADAWHLGSQDAAQKKAAEVLQFVKDSGVDGLDWDYEITTKTGDEDNLLTFFQTLHSDLGSIGREVPMTLTVMASPANSVGWKETWPKPHFTGGPINNLFENFSKCFDGLNLMMYGGPQVLTPDQFLHQWIGKKDGSEFSVAEQFGIPLNEIHVGFMNTAGYPGSKSEGANAADDYVSVLKDLGYKPTDLGETFWWPFNNPQESYADQIKKAAEEIQDYNDEMGKFQSHTRATAQV